MKKIVLTGMMVCLTASMAMAAGLNFYWNPAGLNQCPTVPVAPGNLDQTWDCTVPVDANTGAFVAVGSFTPSKNLLAFNSIAVVIDGQSAGDLPAWWEGFNDGSCRQNSWGIALSTATATAPCTKLWTAAPTGGLGAWQTALNPPPLPPAPGANRVRIKFIYAMTSARVNLNVTKEYNAFSLTMDTNNSIDDPDAGITACAGCNVGLSLVLNEIKVEATPTGTSSRT